jgi:hypothetical protein
MQPSYGRRILAWFITVMVAPPIFLVLLMVTTLSIEAAQDWGHFKTWINLRLFLRDFPQFTFFAIVLALLPTLVLGVPASIALHRKNVRSIMIFAAVGLVLGAIGGVGVVVVLAVLDPNAFQIPARTIIALAAYGAIAAITYNLIERRTSQMA